MNIGTLLTKHVSVPARTSSKWQDRRIIPDQV